MEPAVPPDRGGTHPTDQSVDRKPKYLLNLFCPVKQGDNIKKQITEFESVIRRCCNTTDAEKTVQLFSANNPDLEVRSCVTPKVAAKAASILLKIKICNQDSLEFLQSVFKNSSGAITDPAAPASPESPLGRYSWPMARRPRKKRNPPPESPPDSSPRPKLYALAIRNARQKLTEEALRTALQQTELTLQSYSRLVSPGMGCLTSSDMLVVVLGLRKHLPSATLLVGSTTFSVEPILPAKPEALSSPSPGPDNSYASALMTARPTFQSVQAHEALEKAQSTASVPRVQTEEQSAPPPTSKQTTPRAPVVPRTATVPASVPTAPASVPPVSPAVQRSAPPKPDLRRVRGTKRLLQQKGSTSSGGTCQQKLNFSPVKDIASPALESPTKKSKPTPAKVVPPIQQSTPISPAKRHGSPMPLTEQISATAALEEGELMNIDTNGPPAELGVTDN